MTSRGHNGYHFVERERWELRCDHAQCTRVQPFWIEVMTETAERATARVRERSLEVATRNDWQVVPGENGDLHYCPGPHVPIPGSATE